MFITLKPSKKFYILVVKVLKEEEEVLKLPKFSKALTLLNRIY